MGNPYVHAEQEFQQYNKKIKAYEEAISLAYWDMRTGAPKKGLNTRAEMIGMLSSEVFKMTTSDQMGKWLDLLLKEEAKPYISEITRKAAEYCKKEYDRNKKIPEKEYEEYVILQSKAENVWEEAKEKDDFPMFQPYLEKLVETNKRFITYWGYEDHKYNTLLDLYEEGMTVSILDDVFAQIKEKIIPLVKEITKTNLKKDTKFINGKFPKEAQRDVCIELLKQIGYDFEAGRLDETVHPFEISLNPGDVRVTTKYDEHNFSSAVFGTIHEGGHGIYEQNISNDLVGTPLCKGTSMGIHESQSLFYENFIGRNYYFWKHNFAVLNKYAPELFANVTLDDFYFAINQSKPSLIRIEADELTYPLHIIIRYEIEKGLFNDEISVDQLPVIWNEKYKEYLGIEPPNDREGVLQDVHWAGGSFGYFPSYALGFLYAAQFKQAMEKDLPQFDALLEKGDLFPIKKWLNEKIHRHGAIKKPLEILKDVTGEGLNPDYLIQYFYEKYGALNQLGKFDHS